MTQYQLKKQLHRLSGITPRAEWLSREREQLLSRIKSEAVVEKAPTIKERVRLAGFTAEAVLEGTFSVVAARGMAMALLLVVLLLGSTGYVVTAAENSLPGENLYKIKIALEATRLKMASSPETRVALEVEFATRRLKEVTALAGVNGGNLPQVAELVNRFETDVTRVATTATELSETSPESGLEIARIIDARLAGYVHTLRATNAPANSDLSKQVGKAVAAVNRAGTQTLKVIVGVDSTSDKTDVADRLDEKIRTAEDSLRLADERLAGGAKGSAEAKKSLIEAKEKVEAGDYRAAISIIEEVEDLVYELEDSVSDIPTDIPTEEDGSVLGETDETVSLEAEGETNSNEGADGVIVEDVEDSSTNEVTPENNDTEPAQ